MHHPAQIGKPPRMLAPGNVSPRRNDSIAGSDFAVGGYCASEHFKTAAGVFNKIYMSSQNDQFLM